MWGLRVYVSNRRPGGAAAAGCEPHLEDAQSRVFTKVLAEGYCQSYKHHQLLNGS